MARNQNVGREKFFRWKKIFVRSTHLFIVLFVTGSLFIKETELKRALVFRNYSYFIPYMLTVYLSLLFYFLTCLTSPGYVKLDGKVEILSSSSSDEVPKPDETSSKKTTSLIDGNMRLQFSDDSDVPNPAKDPKLTQIKRRFCDSCKIEQPIRSRHCEECERCIRKFDHHCPWLETCIGEKNHGYFWIFLLVTNILIIWTVVIVVRAFVFYNLWTIWFLRNFYYLLCMHVLLVSLLVCLALFFIHTYFMLNNTTTWERFSRKNITYLKIINDEKLNPFYENCCRNMASFFACGFTYKSGNSEITRIDEERRWENVYVKYMKSKFTKSGSSDESTTILNMSELNKIERVKSPKGQNNLIDTSE